MPKLIGVVLRSHKTSEMVKFYELLLGVVPTIHSHGLDYSHVDLGTFEEGATFGIDNAIPPLAEPVMVVEVEDLEQSREIVITHGGMFERVGIEGKWIYMRDPEARLLILVQKTP